MVISDPRPHRVLKSHKSKMVIIYMQLQKQCALLAITTMALWQLMHLGTWCMVVMCPSACAANASASVSPSASACACPCAVHHVPRCMSCYKAIVVITGRAHCFYHCIYICMYVHTRAFQVALKGGEIFHWVVGTCREDWFWAFDFQKFFKAKNNNIAYREYKTKK